MKRSRPCVDCRLWNSGAVCASAGLAASANVFSEAIAGWDSVSVFVPLLAGAPNASKNGFAAGFLSTQGASVAPWITYDLNAQYIWEEQNLQFNLSINNLFDKSPPFSRTDYSYDAFTANPYGRTVKFGVTANL